MTVNRDIKSDIRETNDLIIKNTKTILSDPSWLGHTKDCGIIDYLLLEGATKENLAKRSGRTIAGVDCHLQHLKSDHGLKISKNNDIFQLEFFHEKSNKTISKEDLQDLMKIDIDHVKDGCLVKLEDKSSKSKWYSIGIKTPNIDNTVVMPLDKNKAFAQNLLDKKVGDFVDFGSGFKILSIKKYLSE